MAWCLGDTLDVNGYNISGYTASKALIANASGNIGVSAVTSTELSYLAGVRGLIQTQLDSSSSGVTGLTASRALISNADGGLVVSDVTSTELSYVTGTTGVIQTQIDGKQDDLNNLLNVNYISGFTPARAIISNVSGLLDESVVTSGELSYLAGVTGLIQTQFSLKQPLWTGIQVTGDLTITGGVGDTVTLTGYINWSNL